MAATLNFGSVEVGRAPRVVGTIASAGTLVELAHTAGEAPCHLVELRRDLVGKEFPGWHSYADLVGTARPVILTVRTQAEGGKWHGFEEARMAEYLAGLRHVAGIDVELRSAIAPKLVAEAQGLGKPVILSYHDFEGTPSLDALRDILAEAAPFKNVVSKVAVMIREPGDVDTLRTLLSEVKDQPVCLLGMGDLGKATRLEFPLLGSCLTYGYLDSTAAPGQLPSRELYNALEVNDG